MPAIPLKKFPNTTWYHGSNHKITNFNLEFVGKGNDQEGPGIYLTDKKEGTDYYAGPDGFIYTIKLSSPRTFSGIPPRAKIEKLIKESPDFEELIIDWGETAKQGVKSYLDNIYEYRADTAKDLFENIPYGSS